MKLRPRYSYLLAACIPVHTQGALAHPPDSKIIIGAIETVAVQDLDHQLEARIDTGATHSSLHAEEIRVFVDTDNRKRVRFRVRNVNGLFRDYSLPLQRTTSIKRHHNRSESRPVVKLRMCLGDIYQEVETTLVDRTGLSYPLLIGRSFLSGRFLVDVSLQHTQAIVCKMGSMGPPSVVSRRSDTPRQKQPRDHQ